MAPKAGTRYVCAKCGVEVIVTRPGEGELKCHGEAMQVKAGGK